MRELAAALTEGTIGSDVRSVGRSIRLRLLRLPEHAGRLARALAILEQSDLLQAARLAGLEELEAADAADLLATAGIIEPGRPLTFVHPLVRDGIYSELSTAERAQGHRRAAQLLAEQPGAEARVAEHLLASEPTDDGWVVERLVAAAREAGKQGAPESEAVFLRRALAEPAPAGNRAALLLDLGMAEASIGHRRLAGALARGRGRCAGRHGCRERNDGARDRPQPRSALWRGGRGSRSRVVLARLSTLRARASARGRGHRPRDERPRDSTVGGPPP